MFRPRPPVRATRQSLSDGSYTASRRGFNPLDREEVRRYGQYQLDKETRAGEIPTNPNLRARYMRENPQAAQLQSMAITGVMPRAVVSDRILDIMNPDRSGYPYSSGSFGGRGLSGSARRVSNLVNALNPAAAGYGSEGFKPVTSASGVTLSNRPTNTPDPRFPFGRPGVNYTTTNVSQGYAGTQSMDQERKNSMFGNV